MPSTDWKDLLQGKLSTLPDEADSPVREELPVQNVAKSKEDLIIRLEKRNGKPATIVSNFQGGEAALKELASALRKHCGTGGSAKDDEMLIQGAVRQKVADFLQKKGHRVRGDFGKK